MGENSGGKKKTPTPPIGVKRKPTPTEKAEDVVPKKKQEKFSSSRRGLFKDYHHIYVEDNKKDYPVLLSPMTVEGASPVAMDLLKTNNVLRKVKGVMYVKAVGRALIKVFFSTKTDAKTFILDQDFLQQNRWQARIPYDHLESQGVIRAPVEISEEELLTNLKSSAEVIGVKRFTRKNGEAVVTTPTLLHSF